MDDPRITPTTPGQSGQSFETPGYRALARNTIATFAGRLAAIGRLRVRRGADRVPRPRHPDSRRVPWAAFGAIRVHYVIWRYTGLKDLIRVVQAASARTVVAVMILVYAYRFVGYSRAVFVIDWMLAIVFVSAARLSFRVLAEYVRPDPASASRVLPYGAGEGGMLVLRELHLNPALERSLVGFVDDDPIKQHRQVQGVPVLGGSDDLAAIIDKYAMEEVVIASTKIPDDQVQRVANICSEHGVRTVRAALHLE